MSHNVLTPTKGLNDDLCTTYNYTLYAILYRNIATCSDMSYKSRGEILIKT